MGVAEGDVADGNPPAGKVGLRHGDGRVGQRRSADFPEVVEPRRQPVRDAVEVSDVLEGLALGAALNDRVPNPFFGTPLGVGILAGTTVTRGQLLKPFPQFDEVNAIRVTATRARYHSFVTRFERRLSDGWGTRINYTWSRLNDNQFGESNFFSRSAADSSGTTGMQNTYDLDSEYSIGILDVPHKVTVSPIVRLPFGPGQRWATSGAAGWLLGDWTISSIISFESGFPVSVSMDSQNTQAFTRVQRANPGTGEAETAWTWRARARMAPHASRGVYVNFLGDDGEGAVRETYRANYERLAAVKASYDPDNIFRRNQNIKPIAKQ